MRTLDGTCLMLCLLPTFYRLMPCIGVRLDDVYDIGHELGTGSFSVVRLGRHRMTGEDVRDPLSTWLSYDGTMRLMTFR